MSKESGSRSPGSPILQLAIVFLIFVLILAIHIPRKQWDEQAFNTEECRNRMMNLDYAAKFYQRNSNAHQSDLALLLEYARQESIVVNPAGFRTERMTREDSGVDSFLISYFDPSVNFSHYEDIIDFHFPGGRMDTLVLTLKPKKEFSYITPSYYTFASDFPINVRHDRRGDQGWFVLLGAQGAIRSQQIIPEPFRVKASTYIYDNFDGTVHSCPSCDENYHTITNVRLAINADLRVMFEGKNVDSSLFTNSELTSLLVFRFLREADALASRDITSQRIIEMTEDSLLRIENQRFLDKISGDLLSNGEESLASAVFDSIREKESFDNTNQYVKWEALRDSLYSHLNKTKESTEFSKAVEDIVNVIKVEYAEVYFKDKLVSVERTKHYSYNENGTINTLADSIDYHADVMRIKSRLFAPHTDQLTKSYMQREDVAKLFNQLSYMDFYGVGKIDTIGINIICPIEGEYVKKNRSFLENLFPVKGEHNHGSIENGKSSWAEKR